jgi:CheY-like chemotaxis protein/predicted regulator of Ras-like GTPase activity (Roadblock/LC7/MglB family)
MPKVLIVDDSLSVRKVVERILEARQMQVLQASLGAEAIDAIQRETPDLVLCDVLLPDKDGYEVCQFVKSHPRFRRTPVLLISGIVNPAVIARAAEVGSEGVLQKPFSAEELTRKVGDLLARSPMAPRSPDEAAMPGSVGTLTPLPAPAAPVQTNGAAAHRMTLEGCLASLAQAEGVHAVVLADRDGRTIGAAGNAGAAGMLGAMTACLASASDELGVELGRGDLQGLILEHGKGLVLVSVVGDGAVLALVLDEPAALGKARYYVKKAVPDLLGAL